VLKTNLELALLNIMQVAVVADPHKDHKPQAVLAAVALVELPQDQVAVIMVTTELQIPEVAVAVQVLVVQLLLADKVVAEL
jgi:hypothetical protein